MYDKIMEWVTLCVRDRKRAEVCKLDGAIMQGIAGHDVGDLRCGKWRLGNTLTYFFSSGRNK